MSNDTNDDEETIHRIDITTGSFPQQITDRFENGDTIEFENNQTDEFDIFQVYKDENNFYRVDNGLTLLNISKTSSNKERRLPISFVLNQSEIDLYFCVIRSNEHETYSKSRQIDRTFCEKNHLIIHKNELKITLTDNKESQKIVLRQGDTIELDWITKRTGGYRIEEKKYCPISGGLYRVEQTANLSANTKGNFRKVFHECGTSFLFRLTETNQIHDIIVCVIKDKYRITSVELTDTNIQPNVIQIEQNDIVQFQWNTKQQKQMFGQIEPFNVDQQTQQSIEVCGEIRNETSFFFCFLVENRRRTFLLAV